ncbi:MAG TPA: DUF1572 family protein [Terriglobia bacterium]|nr:DUF1572 family protein [Terriglobia bacterium]
MKKQHTSLAGPIVGEARRVMVEIYPPRIIRCLKLLSEEEIWWRPNRASNSVGNLVLHLQGNVRQWIICGLGGQADQRDRDREFTERGSVPRRALLAGLRKTLKEADQVLAKIGEPDLARQFSIQGFEVTGLQVVCHVAEHFAFHAGQIIFVTKLKCRKDLRFTHLPAQQKASKKTKPSL